LLKGVPHRELKLVFVVAGRNFDGDFDEMALGIGKSNYVADGGLRKADRAEKDGKQMCEATPGFHRWLPASAWFAALRDFRRWGSFS
jgi:hypothetical protein